MKTYPYKTSNLSHLLKKKLTVFRKLEDLSVDEFLLSGGVDSADDNDSEEEVSKQNGSKKSKKKAIRAAPSKP